MKPKTYFKILTICIAFAFFLTTIDFVAAEECSQEIKGCCTISNPEHTYYYLGNDLYSPVNYDYKDNQGYTIIPVCLFINTTQHVEIDCKGFTIQPNDLGNQKVAILAASNSDVTIKNCIIKNYWNGILLNNTWGEIENNTFLNTPNVCKGMCNYPDLKVAAISIENSQNKKTIIKDNVMTYESSSYIGDHVEPFYGIFISNSNGTYIDYITTNNVYLSSITNNVITTEKDNSNYVGDGYDVGIYLKDSNNFIISNNNITVNPYNHVGFAIILDNSSNNTISNNFITPYQKRCEWGGSDWLYCNFGSAINVGFDGEYWMPTGKGEKNIIKNNNIIYCDQCLFSVDPAEVSSIVHVNSVFYITYGGIQIFSNYNEVSYNNITNCTYGLYVEGNNTTIENNIIEESATGIILSQSLNNNITNNFINGINSRSIAEPGSVVACYNNKPVCSNGYYAICGFGNDAYCDSSHQPICKNPGETPSCEVGTPVCSPFDDNAVCTSDKSPVCIVSGNTPKCASDNYNVIGCSTTHTPYCSNGNPTCSSENEYPVCDPSGSNPTCSSNGEISCPNNEQPICAEKFGCFEDVFSYGFYFENSSSNKKIENNTIKSYGGGIILNSSSNNNIFTNNNITNNGDWDIFIAGSSGNKFGNQTLISDISRILIDILDYTGDIALSAIKSSDTIQKDPENYQNLSKYLRVVNFSNATLNLAIHYNDSDNIGNTKYLRILKYNGSEWIKARKFSTQNVCENDKCVIADIFDLTGDNIIIGLFKKTGLSALLDAAIGQTVGKCWPVINYTLKCIPTKTSFGTLGICDNKGYNITKVVAGLNATDYTETDETDNELSIINNNKCSP